MTATQTDALLTGKDVAAMLQCSTRTIHRWVTAGKLEAVRLGDRVKRFRPEAVRAFLAGNAK